MSVSLVNNFHLPQTRPVLVIAKEHATNNNLSLSPHFFKKAKGIFLSPLSVCTHEWTLGGYFQFPKFLYPTVRASLRPLCYLLLNHWTKFNKIWCVSYSHEWSTQQQFFGGPRPLWPWGGVKRSNII